MWRTRVNAWFSLARYLGKFLWQTQAWLDCVSAELLLLPFFKDFRGLQHTQRHDRVLTRHVVFLAWSCLCEFFDCFDRSIFWSYFLAHSVKHRVHPYPFHELFKSPSLFSRSDGGGGDESSSPTSFIHPISLNHLPPIPLLLSSFIPRLRWQWRGSKKISLLVHRWGCLSLTCPSTPLTSLDLLSRFITSATPISPSLIWYPSFSWLRRTANSRT